MVIFTLSWEGSGWYQGVENKNYVSPALDFVKTDKDYDLNSASNTNHTQPVYLESESDFDQIIAKETYQTEYCILKDFYLFLKQERNVDILALVYSINTRIKLNAKTKV